MKTGFKLLLGASLLLGCAGCGENKVKLDVAKSLSDNAIESSTKVASYFDEVEAQRRMAAAAFVASDPSCLPTRPVTWQRRTTRARKSAPLCPAGAAAEGYKLDVMDFATKPQDIMKARLLMISAVGDYGRALAKILAGKAPDIKGELTSFAEKVDRVGTLLALITGEEQISAGDQLTSPKGKSILALAQFVADLAHEAEQVDAVVARVKLDGAKVDIALEELRQDVLIRAQGTMAGASNMSRNRMLAAYEAERKRMSFTERRALALEIFAAEDAEVLIPEKAQVVADALAETATAQKNLRNALSGKFTPAQKRKIAAENLDRITRAMGMIASIGAAFR